MGHREGAVSLWMGLVALLTGGQMLQVPAGGGGLFTSSACISPAVLLILTLTPAETFVNVSVAWLRRRAGLEESEE